MGQNVSMSSEEQNQLYNLLGANPAQKPKVDVPAADAPVQWMRMMARTAPPAQQRVMQGKPQIRRQHHVQPVAKVRRESVRQAR